MPSERANCSNSTSESIRNLEGDDAPPPLCAGLEPLTGPAHNRQYALGLDVCPSGAEGGCARLETSVSEVAAIWRHEHGDAIETVHGGPLYGCGFVFYGGLLGRP